MKKQPLIDSPPTSVRTASARRFSNLNSEPVGCGSIKGRIVLTVVAGALGLVVCGMARAASFPQLAVWVTLTRGLGQSALSVISIALVGHWFARRIDTAMAVYSIVLSVGFMAAFPLVGWLVQAWGWPHAWFALGAALIAGLAPLSWLIG